MKEREPNTYIKPSSIHGLGLFAKVDIAKGQLIIQGKADFEVDIYSWLRYLKNIKVKSFAYNNGCCMVNHSESPNTHRSKRGGIVASFDIKKGFEITEDYNALTDEENPFKSVGGFLQEAIFHAKHRKK